MIVDATAAILAMQCRQMSAVFNRTFDQKWITPSELLTVLKAYPPYKPRELPAGIMRACNHCGEMTHKIFEICGGAFCPPCINHALDVLGNNAPE